MKETKFTIGADCEVFLIDKNGKYISAIEKIGGSKVCPRLLTNKGHAVQEDNVAAEFNIPACNDKQEFVNNLQLSLSLLKDIVPTGLTIDLKSSAIFEKEQLEHPAAQEFGCSPDYSAYTLSENKRPNTEQYPGLRSIGSHIHIGYESPSMQQNVEIIKFMDLFLGIPSLILDKDINRRKLYGNIGCFRPKNYGLEYRVLSSFWIANEKLMQWAYEGTKRAVNSVMEGKTMNDGTIKIMKECFKTHSIKKIADLIEEFNIEMPIAVEKTKEEILN